jgi:plastocyanin
LQTYRITVERERRSQPKGFSPEAQLMEPGDAVFWFNSDRRTSHQPIPDDASSGSWVANPIGPKQESDQANFSGDPKKTVVQAYHCKFHSDETGSLNIVPATTITRAPDNTVAFAAASIDVGGYVWWRNLDQQAEHQPIADDRAAGQWFDSPLASGARSTSIQFKIAATVNYHCALHPAEKGVITVGAVQKAGG